MSLHVSMVGIEVLRHADRYPSLLESSDADGGSSVAVLTYLRCILESIHYPDLIRLILRYLLALPELQPDESTVSKPTTVARRRKSHSLRTDLAKGEERPSPGLFTLVDLIWTSLESHNQQTITATLRLCTTILSRHHPYAISTLVKTNKSDVRDHRRTLKDHDLQLDALLLMAEDLGMNDGLGESYETHLQDVRNLLETHCCSAHLLALPGIEASPAHEVGREHDSMVSKPMGYHRIAADDSLMMRFLILLKNFFANDIETNLSLTQVLTVLASCGYTCTEGWLLGNMDRDCSSSDPDVNLGDEVDKVEKSSSGITNDDQARELSPSRQVHKNNIRSSRSNSPIFATFDSLIDQVDSFRQKIQDFDILLAERRHIFKVGEEMESALAETSTSPRVSEDSNSASPKRFQKPSHLVSLPQRFLSEATSSNASRASSPRGRQKDDIPSSALAKKLGYLRISPSPNPSKNTPRTYSASPLRKEDRDPSPSIPPKFVTPMGPPDAFRQKIKLSATPTRRKPASHDPDGSEASSVRSASGSIEPGAGETEEVKEISLGHLLTNIIILQEFMLELAAIIEVRATLFGEIR